jgi:hypothetical protein
MGRLVIQMRTMNLPPFPGEQIRIANPGEFVRTRLALETVPWPDHSWRLLAHMAWPNDQAKRDLWMAAQIGTQLECEKRAQGEGSSAETDATPPYLPAQNASWEYFRLFGGHVPLADFVSKALIRRNREDSSSVGGRRRSCSPPLRHERRQVHAAARWGEHPQSDRSESGALPKQGTQQAKPVEDLE